MSNNMDRTPVPGDDMSLPEGMTCGDCRSFKQCEGLFGCIAPAIRCDWSPSKFSPSVEALRAERARVDDTYSRDRLHFLTATINNEADLAGVARHEAPDTRVGLMGNKIMDLTSALATERQARERAEREAGQLRSVLESLRYRWLFTAQEGDATAALATNAGKLCDCCGRPGSPGKVGVWCGNCLVCSPKAGHFAAGCPKQGWVRASDVLAIIRDDWPLDDLAPLEELECKVIALTGGGK